MSRLRKRLFGIGVIVFATFIAIFFIPMFFRLFTHDSKAAPREQASAERGNSSSEPAPA